MKKSLLILAALLLPGMLTYAADKDKLVAKLSSRVYFDGTAFLNNNENYIGSGSTISDIRLGASGTYGKFEGKIDLGFAKKAVSFKDVYIAYHFNPTSYVRLGHYAEPFGIDYMESSGNIKFVDAGIVMQAFCPGRKLGFEYIGWTKNIWFGAGAFADSNFADRLKRYGNDGYALTGRLVFNPIHEEGKVFHVGVAGTYREADAPASAGVARSVSYATTLGSPVNSQKFVDAVVTDAKGTAKVGAELIAAYDKVAFQGEYIYSNTSRHNDLKSFNGYGAYGQVSFLAIGSPYEYSSKWARMELPKPGSLEFAARYAHVDLNCPDAKIMGGIQNQLTIACNYYWKSFLRVRLNYDMAHVKGLKSFNFITGRVQLLF